jgi:hypothetical protein
MHKIIVGRDQWDLEKYGDKGTGFIGKSYVGEKKDARLTVPVYLDLSRPHVIGVFGKRGTGKSYTLGTIVEEMMLLPENIRKNVSAIVVDTMGIFWSMKYPNDRDFKLLMNWNLHARSFPVNVLVLKGLEKEYRAHEIPYDGTFSFRPDELTAEEWGYAFNLDLMSEAGIYLERLIRMMKFKYHEYLLEDIISELKASEFEKRVKDALLNRFLIAEEWGIFSKESAILDMVVKPGSVTILDVSLLGAFSLGWNVRTLIVGLLARKILYERMKARRKEEIENVSGIERSHMPIIWMVIDEAHQFIPAKGTTAATEPLLQWVKIGREPGVSLVLATQQPNKLHEAAISQMDIVISHRLTARDDIEALRNIMQTYLRYDLAEYIDRLPRVKGAAIILDDNSERIYAVQIRPRISWHAGGSPIAIKE